MDKLILQFLSENSGFQHEDKIIEAVKASSQLNKYFESIRRLEYKGIIITDDKNIKSNWRLVK